MSGASVGVASGLLLAAAVASCLAWFVVWITLEPVAGNVQDKVNWYAFMKLRLLAVHEVYGALRVVGLGAPLPALLAGACLRRGLLGRLPLAVLVVLVVYNASLGLALVLAGRLLLALLAVVAPLRLALLLHAGWWPLLATPTAAAGLLCLCHHCYHGNLGGQRGYCCKSFLVVMTTHVLLAVGVAWLVSFGCTPCPAPLPPRPFLVGHRGCSADAPENTVAAFTRAIQLPDVRVLESDVYLSLDGVPFLLHDPHLLRTTDVRLRCPDLDPSRNASWLAFSSGPCPLSQLRAGRYLAGGHTPSPADRAAFANETVPSLAQLLAVARAGGRGIILDIQEPPPGHPAHATFLNTTLHVITASGLEQGKVWWLASQHRAWVQRHFPAFTQAAKSRDLSFEDILQQRIALINDDWSTPVDLFRRYQAANLTINMFFVESDFMFDYAWCLGMRSITTSHCRHLSTHSHNSLFQACQELREKVSHLLLPLTLTFALCSASCWLCLKYRRRYTAYTVMLGH